MDRPNILCISIDSLRADYTSLSEQDSHNTTPFLNSIASESTVYHSAITPSTWTLPVHTSVFTGLFPPEHGVTTGKEVLGDHPTFAELLSEEGYSTRAFYKNSWLDTSEITRGFKTPSREGFNSGNSKKSFKKQLSELIGRASPDTEMFLECVYEAQKQYRQWKQASESPLDQERDGKETINKAVGETKGANQPFCWFLHLNDAHWKYNPPRPFHRKFTERSDLSLAYNYGFWQERVYGTRTNRLKTTVGDIDPPRRAVDTFKELYRGGIRYCDYLIEQLIEELRVADVWENTVLIVFGDHGDGFGEDGVFGHHFSVHDSVIHVPLLIRDPTNQIEPGSVFTPVSLVDIYPTILQLAGIRPPETNAINLSSGEREYAYTYYDISNYEYYTEAGQRGVSKNQLPPSCQYAIVGENGDKSIEYPQDSSSTPITENNILQDQLNNHTKQLNKVPTREGRISDDVADRLEKMGYLRE